MIRRNDVEMEDKIWKEYSELFTIKSVKFRGRNFLKEGSMWNKQQVVALSTTESEYMVITSSATQALWLRRMLGFLQHKQDGPTKIFCDSMSAIELTKNPVFHGRSKHIDIKYHFIRELVQEQEIAIDYCRSEDQVADILTKPLKLEMFMKLKKMLGMVKFEDLDLREAM